jgi:hypothetical protein
MYLVQLRIALNSTLIKFIGLYNFTIKILSFQFNLTQIISISEIKMVLLNRITS